MKKVITLLLLIVVVLPAMAQRRTAATTFEEAKAAIEDGRYDEGVGFFRKQLRDDPKDWVSAYYVVWADVNLENYREMMEASETVIRYGKKDGLAYIYRCRAMAQFKMTNSLDAVLREIDKAIKIDPNDYYCLRLRADVYMDMAIDEMKAAGEYDSVNTFARTEGSKAGEKWLNKSDEDYRRIVKNEPDFSQGYGGLALNSYLRRQFDDALDYGRQALTASTQNNSEHYWVMMQIYIMREQYGEACDVYIRGLDAPVRMNNYFWVLEETLVENAFATLQTKLQIQSNKESDNASWPYTIGRLYGSKGNVAKQVEYYKRAYRRMPTSAWYATRVAAALAEQGNWKGSMAYAKRAVGLEPDNSMAHYTLSTALYYSDRGEDAIAEVTKAIELAPTYSFYYYRRGFYNDNLGHTDEAIEDFSAAIELDPDYAYAYMQRGDMYERRAQYGLARKDYRRTVEIDTAITENMCAQYAYLALGDTAAAVKLVDRQLDSFPDEPGVLYDATCIYSRMGRYEQALNYLENALRSGYTHWAHMRLDDDLDPLRDMPRYKQLMEKYKEPSFGEEEDMPDYPDVNDTRSTRGSSTQSGSSTSNTIRSLAPRN